MGYKASIIRLRRSALTAPRDRRQAPVLCQQARFVMACASKNTSKIYFILKKKRDKVQKDRIFWPSWWYFLFRSFQIFVAWITTKTPIEMPQKHRLKCHKNTDWNTTKTPIEMPQKHRLKYHKNTDWNTTKTPIKMPQKHRLVFVEWKYLLPLPQN